MTDPYRRCSRRDPRLRHNIVSRIKVALDRTEAELENRRQSFVDLGRWLTDCRALASPHLVTVLVGNKLDREEEREVEYVEGSRWAQENGEYHCLFFLMYLVGSCSYPGLLFVEVSSLSGENVTTPFLLCARTILSSLDSGVIDPDQPGTGVSYGERQLRAVGSVGRLSNWGGGGTSKKKRRRADSVSLREMVGANKCSC